MGLLGTPGLSTPGLPTPSRTPLTPLLDNQLDGGPGSPTKARKVVLASLFPKIGTVYREATAVDTENQGGTRRKGRPPLEISLERVSVEAGPDVEKSLSVDHELGRKEPIFVSTAGRLSKLLPDIIAELAKAEKEEYGDQQSSHPIFTPTGINTSYFVRIQGESVAIFKPMEGEVGGVGAIPNKEAIKSREGIVPGECAQKEVIAYLLRRGAPVPETAMVTLKSKHFYGDQKQQRGSLQLFEEGASSLDQVMSDGISRSFDLLNVQRIALSDLVLNNTDRIVPNLLTRQRGDGVRELIPIDHGCLAPRGFLHSPPQFCWSQFPQAQEPIHADVLAEIAALDWESDKQRILELFPHYATESLEVMEMCYALVKIGAEKGLTFAEMSTFFVQQDIFTRFPMRTLYNYLRSNQGFNPQSISDAISSMVEIYQKEKGIFDNIADLHGKLNGEFSHDGGDLW